MNNYTIIANDCDISMELMREHILESCKTKNIPANWFLLSCLYEWDMPRDTRLADVFGHFVKDLYPDFELANDCDLASAVKREMFLANTVFIKMYGFGFASGLVVVDENGNESILQPNPREKKLWDRALYFGEIVTEFMIKVQGYSVINHDDKTITTTKDISELSFLEYLGRGYKFQERSALAYVNTSDNPLAKKEFIVVEPTTILDKSPFSL